MFHVFTTYQRPVFEGAEEPGIFSIPEPRGKLGIFPSPRAYMKETIREVTSRNSLHSVLRQRAVFKGKGNFELFQVPEIPEPRRKWAWDFSKSQGIEGVRSESSKSQGLGGSPEVLSVSEPRRKLGIFLSLRNMKKYVGKYLTTLILLLLNLLVRPKNEGHVSCLHLALAAGV